MNNTIFPFHGLWFSRLSGMFPEPGHMGSMAGILLSLGTILRSKPWMLFLTGILGVLSLSLAFFIFLPLLVGYYFFQSSRARWIILLLIGALFLGHFHDGFSKIIEKKVYHRFQFNPEKTTIAGDNRSKLGQAFWRYANQAESLPLLIGNGSRSIREVSFPAIHYRIIYEHGLIGYSLIAGLCFALFIHRPLFLWKRPEYLFLTLIPLLSLYQRPDFLLSHYLLFFGVLARERGVFLRLKPEQPSKQVYDAYPIDRPHYA